MSDAIAEDARLMILRELASSGDGRSNEVVLDRVLAAYGVRRSRDWLRTQLARLADLDAVRVETVGTVTVATLRQAGRDHIERRSLLTGVARPADDA